MSFDIFQNIMTASDPAGGRAIKVTLQTGIDDAESYYTKSDSAGGRAIKVSLIDSGALILAGNVPLSTTPIAVADGAGSTSPLQLGTTRIVMNTGAAASRATLNITSLPYTAGNGDQNHPVLLFGAHGGNIWAESPNGGTYIGINAVNSFPGNFLDFHVNGGASVFKVAASGNVYIGANSSSTAKLNVKGEGTNNIVRFETSGIHQAFAINSNGAITIARDGNIGPQIYPFNASEVVQDILGFGLGFTSNKVNFATNNYDVFFSGQNIATTSGIANYVTIRRTFTAPAGTASFRPLNVEYTINNSGAQTGGATATGIFLNATETTLFGMTHNLMDLQVGGSSRFKVAGDGTTTFGMNSAILNLGGNAVATLNLGNGGTNFAVSGGVPSLNGVSATNSWLLINSSNANSRAIIQVCGSSAATTASIPNTSIGSAPGATIFYNSTTTNYVESFRIKGTGVINSPTLPSSNVGLSSGDWYYDTAANILANGDKILARKA